VVSGDYSSFAQLHQSHSTYTNRHLFTCRSIIGVSISTKLPLLHHSARSCPLFIKSVGKRKGLRNGKSLIGHSPYSLYSLVILPLSYSLGDLGYTWRRAKKPVCSRRTNQFSHSTLPGRSFTKQVVPSGSSVGTLYAITDPDFQLRILSSYFTSHLHLDQLCFQSCIDGSPTHGHRLQHTPANTKLEGLEIWKISFGDA